MSLVLGKRTGALSVVHSRVGPPKPLRPQEADDAALARANSEPAAEHGRPSGATRGWAAPVRELPLHPAGEHASAGADSEPVVADDPVTVRTRLRQLTLEQDGVSGPAGADALDGMHAPTARVIHQLKRARHKLQRTASPALRLSPAIRALWRTEIRLARPLRVAVCGEINSGKSSLANLLAGSESLPTAILSNTRIPTLLYYAAEPEVWTVHPNGKRARLRSDRSMPREEIFRIDVGLPSRRLQALQIVDLPGLVDPRSGFPEIDLAAHHVDAAIWCTMSTQAWKESERSAWSLLPPRLSNRGLLVATHRDLLHSARDCEKLLGRLRDEVGTSFADIILISTSEALAVMGKDRRGVNGDAWIASGGQALESALGNLLSQLREQRAAAALRMTSRVAHRALVRIDGAHSDA
jgi:Dynamin family